MSEEMAEQTNLVLKRDLKRVICQHALDVAREKGYEVLGWLVGFFSEDTVYICDAVPCTKYKRQSRYSAESDPAEEAMLAARFPRNVGIVGLYHSHPFKMDEESGEFRRLFGVSELFHSGTDDAMLRSRSSRMKNYVSIVTDVESISCYIMVKKRPKKIKENMVNSINFTDHIRPINSKVHLTFQETYDVSLGLRNMIRTMEERLISTLNMKLKDEDVALTQGPVGNVLRILPFEPGANDKAETKGNYFHITPSKGSMKIKAVMNLTPTIYVPKGYIDMEKALESMINEISDYIVYLTWNEMNYTEIEKHIKPEIKELEIHLGKISTKYNEESGVPMKIYSRPKRRMSIKKK
jgi:proteasome lid subunit RPN8/RPN11